MSAQKTSESLKSLILKRAKPATKPVISEEENSQKAFKSFSEYPQVSYKGKASGVSLLVLPQRKWKEDFEWSSLIVQVNQEIFKHSEFRGLQKEIINAVLSGEDIIVVMPTGSGKSLTYQLPGVITNGLTIVIEPLLSLINDQVKKLESLEIGVVCLTGSQSLKKQEESLNSLQTDKNIKFLYITPEKLAKSDRFVNLLEKMHKNNQIARLVVDEAHCICEWGRDFRPDYLKLQIFRMKFPNVPIIGLTASGTQVVRSDISKLLCLKDPILFSSGFNRPNLFYEVRDKPSNLIQEIAHFITTKHSFDSGIIYCNYIKDCELLSNSLKHNYKLKSAYYHSELDPDKKTEIQKKWMSEEIKIMVATLAFGLGIDKNNVRFVLHYSIPESLERYYQETGRAGRDGLSADCVLFYKYEDKCKLESLVSFTKAGDIHKMIEYCENFHVCRRKFLLSHLGESVDPECSKMCDVCCSNIEYVEVDVTAYVLDLLNDLKKRLPMFNTLIQIVDVLRGCNNKPQAHLKSLQSFGMMTQWTKKNVERLIKKLVFDKILEEEKVTLKWGSGYYKLYEGPNARLLYSGANNVKMFFRADYLHPKVSDKEEAWKEDYYSEEIFDRLKLVRKKLSKAQHLPENDVLSDEIIKKLAVELPDFYPGVSEEFLHEISHYKKMNTIDDLEFSLDFDKLDPDLIDCFSSKKKSNSEIFSKKIKK